MSDQQNNPSHSSITSQLGYLLDDVFLVLTPDRCISFANDMAVRLFGEHLEGRDAGDLFNTNIFVDAFEETTQFNTAADFFASTKSDPTHQYRIRMRSLEDNMIGLLMMDMTAEHHLEKVRQDFVANVSHELRSPLTSLIGFIETMETTEHLDKNVQAKFLGIMSEEARRMSRLINDLLSLSRVEVEEHVVPTEVIFIDKIVTSVISSFQSRALARDMSVVFNNKVQASDGRGLQEGIIMLGDADEMMEVFHNLIDNALKYAFPATDISVVMSYPDDVNVAFDVINKGEGIEEIHLSRLTERFYRVDKSRSRKIGGTGLGLAIVKHIVARHRGTISITSETSTSDKLGVTNFRVVLPRHKLTS